MRVWEKDDKSERVGTVSRQPQVLCEISIVLAVEMAAAAAAVGVHSEGPPLVTAS